MSAEEKLKLIEKIRESDDAVLLSQLSKLMDISTIDDPYQLSSKQVNVIEIAEDQIKYGDILTHDEAKRETQKWFDK